LDSEIELLDRDWRDESTGESGRELGQIEDLADRIRLPAPRQHGASGSQAIP
jgi:hypothetical protein